MPSSAKPVPPIFQAVLQPIQAFFKLQAASGIILMAATIAALIWANSSAHPLYERLFHLPLGVRIGGQRYDFSLHALINDGLMAVFFFVVGMEIKRELVAGELRTFSRAILPAIAALGGMIVPGLIYLAFNAGKPTSAGWAIPMATDIAFSIGVLTLLIGRVHQALVVFLTALAIFDDMGGIVVIALFYGAGVQAKWLLAALVLVLGLALWNRLYIRSGLLWLFGGALLWLCLHNGGIHATISGVILGFCIPAKPRRSPREVLDELHAHTGALKNGDANVDAENILQIEETLEDVEPPLNRFVHMLHPYVAYLIIPLFALANAGVNVQGSRPADLFASVPLGIALGLLVGKPLGIFLFTMLAVKLGMSPMPGNAPKRQLFGTAVVGGIGFTVALFVATLSFADARVLDAAKLGILVGSALAAALGYLLLRIFAAPKLPGPAPRATVPSP